MVKVVVPLGVQPDPPRFPRADQACIVEVALGDEMNLPVQSLRPLLYGQSQVFQEGLGRKIQDGVEGVETQCVHMEFGDPEKGIFDEKAPDLVAMRSVEIDRLPQGVL